MTGLLLAASLLGDFLRAGFRPRVAVAALVDLAAAGTCVAFAHAVLRCRDRNDRGGPRQRHAQVMVHRSGRSHRRRVASSAAPCTDSNGMGCANSSTCASGNGSRTVRPPWCWAATAAPHAFEHRNPCEGALRDYSIAYNSSRACARSNERIRSDTRSAKPSGWADRVPRFAFK